MTDKPILFSAPMIRAILAGSKTQTRRIIKPQPDPAFIGAEIGAESLTFRPALLFGSDTHFALCRVPRPGDRLWVMEESRILPLAESVKLLVEAVKVERLQDISLGDVIEEGCPFPNRQAGLNPRDWFRDIWSEINGPGSWDENPWVVAITFRPVPQNIDAIKEPRDG